MKTAIDRPFILDIEASGFGPNGYPIEIGIAMGSGEKFCSLIRPLDEWTHWDAEAEKLHRIPRDILETYGKPLHEVVLNLNSLLEGQTVYSDAWVLDKTWLTTLVYASAIPQQFTLSSLELILSETQIDIWDVTKQQIMEELNLSRHRASSDALVIQETFIRTKTLSTQ
jgi:hypothetical protein